MNPHLSQIADVKRADQPIRAELVPSSLRWQSLLAICVASIAVVVLTGLILMLLSGKPPQEMGGSSPVAAVASDKSTADNAKTEPAWREFVDKGGRFRCRVPPNAEAAQKETGTRSKVSVRLGDIELGALVRDTQWHEIRQQELDELVNNLKKIAPGSTIRHQRLGRADDSVTADVAAAIPLLGQTMHMRQVKFKKHGYDHLLTVTVTGKSFDAANALFEQFIQSYRSVDPREKQQLSVEKRLPAELDYTLPDY